MGQRAKPIQPAKAARRSTDPQARKELDQLGYIAEANPRAERRIIATPQQRKS